MQRFLINLGKVLFRYRAVIAIPFFIILVIFSKPTHLPLISYILIVFGLLIRIWAACYIGTKSRENKFTTQYIITNGPYRYLKHPLYIGNFLLVLGVIILFNPALWLAILLIASFLLEYSIIIHSELNYLKDLPKKEAEFKLSNSKSEISTILILIIIGLIYLLILQY